MYSYQFAAKKLEEIDLRTFVEDKPPESFKPGLKKDTFLITSPEDMIQLQPLFGFDQETVADCLNYDENIRHEAYSGYDFISLLYFYVNSDLSTVSAEVNIYLGKNYCLLVLPDDIDDGVLSKWREQVMAKITKFGHEELSGNRICYFIMDAFLQRLLESMERIEDEINKMEDFMLNHQVDKNFLGSINRLREIAYLLKKMCRPLLYVGDGLLMNENGLIAKENYKFFKNIDTRINKLYDFSVSLQEYSNQMLGIYESKIAMQTNEVVNKLTVITVFFAPLTIITGIYGMNFIYMPELSWKLGYLFSFGLMALVSLIIYIILKIKKWI